MENPYLKIQNDIEELQKGINDYVNSTYGKNLSDENLLGKKIELLNEYLSSTKETLEKQIEFYEERIKYIEYTLQKYNVELNSNNQRNNLINLKHEAEEALKIIFQVEDLING